MSMKLSTTCELDTLDKQLLTQLQEDIPLAQAPFTTIAQQLGISLTDVLARIARLKAGAVVRQMSAIFDTRTLGYRSSLVAMKVAEDQVDAAAAVINEHPGVSHNYKRNDAYNLWFTVAVPSTDSIERAVTILHHHAQAQDTIILPTLRLYKIGVKLDLTGEAAKQEAPEQIYNEARRHATAGHTLTHEDISAIRILQEDAPLVERPFAVWAEGTTWTEDTLLEHARFLQTRGFMRRFAAILHHRNAGFKANAMVVWHVPEDQVDAIGAHMAQQREVSHCYRRPIFPEWPYALFTMIHAPSYSACMAVVQRIEDNVGTWEHKNLFSTKEYKKVRLKYFTSAMDAWSRRYGDVALPVDAAAHVCSVPGPGVP